jgi:hypothetical protein
MTVRRRVMGRTRRGVMTAAVMMERCVTPAAAPGCL